MSVRSRLITQEADLEALEEPWLELLADSCSNEPVLTPQWLLAWWQVYASSQNRRLRALAFFHHDRLVGLAPLSCRRALHRGVIPIKRVDLLGAGEHPDHECCSCYVGIICRRGSERLVVETLADALCSRSFSPWDELEIPEMSGDSPLPALLRDALARRSCTAELSVCDETFYVALPARWEAYVETLSRKSRYLVRRTLRDFERWAESSLCVEMASSPADLQHGLQILIELHEQRWHAAGKSGAFASSLFRRFHEQALAQMMRKGAAQLRWLSAHGRPVAALYELIWDNRIYQAGRAVGMPRHIRPGMTLLLYSIQDAIAHQRREYDLLCGEARYKRQLANNRRPLMRLSARRPTLAARACTAVDTATRVARHLRQMAGKVSPREPPQHVGDADRGRGHSS